MAAPGEWPDATELYFLLCVIGTGAKEPTMKTVVAILALVLLAVGPAAAKSAKKFAPGHYQKGAHGASAHAPGHVKKSLGLHSASGVSPGHMKKY